MPKPPLKRPPTSGTRKGNGAGWGGPAKGEGIAGEPVPFDAGNQAAVGHGGYDLTRQQKREALHRKLYDLAMGAETEAVQLAATNACLDRLEGKPIALNVNLDADGFADLDDAALDARRQELERELDAARSRAVAAAAGTTH